MKNRLNKLLYNLYKMKKVPEPAQAPMELAAPTELTQAPMELAAPTEPAQAPMELAAPTELTQALRRTTRVIISTMTILAVVTTLTVTSTVGAFAERAAHGEDAHSPSMSVGSGENPIPDKSTTRENSGGEIVDGPDTEAGAGADASADAETDADADAEADVGDEEEQKLKELTDGVAEQVVPGEEYLVPDGEDLQQPEWQSRLYRYWSSYRFPIVAAGAVLLIVLFVLIRAIIRRIGGAASAGRKDAAGKAAGGRDAQTGKRAAGASDKYGKRYKK